MPVRSGRTANKPEHQPANRQSGQPRKPSPTPATIRGPSAMDKTKETQNQRVQRNEQQKSGRDNLAKINKSSRAAEGKRAKNQNQPGAKPARITEAAGRKKKANSRTSLAQNKPATRINRTSLAAEESRRPEAAGRQASENHEPAGRRRKGETEAAGAIQQITNQPGGQKQAGVRRTRPIDRRKSKNRPDKTSRVPPAGSKARKNGPTGNRPRAARGNSHQPHPKCPKPGRKPGGERPGPDQQKSVTPTSEKPQAAAAPG